MGGYDVRKKYTLEEVHEINKSGVSDEEVMRLLNADTPYKVKYIDTPVPYYFENMHGRSAGPIYHLPVCFVDDEIL